MYQKRYSAKAVFNIFKPNLGLNMFIDRSLPFNYRHYLMRMNSTLCSDEQN